MTTPVTQQSFDDFASRVEAVLGTVLTRMDGLETGLSEVRSEVAEVRSEVAEVRSEVAAQRVDHLDMRASFAELRTSVSELRLRSVEYEQAAKSRFETLTDAIADLRNEYRGHTHD